MQRQLPHFESHVGAMKQYSLRLVLSDVRSGRQEERPDMTPEMKGSLTCRLPFV